jgi:hypothetical protein
MSPSPRRSAGISSAKAARAAAAAQKMIVREKRAGINVAVAVDARGHGAGLSIQ